MRIVVWMTKYGTKYKEIWSIRQNRLGQRRKTR